MDKNYNEYTAPEGFYYRKGDVFAKALILPLSFSIDEYELVTEDVYQAFEAEQEAKMKEEMEKRESERLNPEN